MSDGRGFDDGDRGTGRPSVPRARGADDRTPTPGRDAALGTRGGSAALRTTVVSPVDVVFAELVRDLPVVEFDRPVTAERLTETAGPDLAGLLHRLEVADADHFTRVRRSGPVNG